METKETEEVRENPTWTIMGSSKHKGKSIVGEYTMPKEGTCIGCSNGFDVLGVGKIQYLKINYRDSSLECEGLE